METQAATPEQSTEPPDEVVVVAGAELVVVETVVGVVVGVVVVGVVVGEVVGMVVGVEPSSVIELLTWAS